MSYVKPARKRKARPKSVGLGAENNNGNNNGKNNGKKTTDVCVPVWAAIVLGGLSAWGIIRTIK
jgi:hypothetical protein